MTKEEMQDINFEKNCILRCLESCETPAQIESVQKMVATFDKKWDKYSHKLELIREEMLSAIRISYKETTQYINYEN
jgi:hypothetical protein